MLPPCKQQCPSRHRLCTSDALRPFDYSPVIVSNRVRLALIDSSADREISFPLGPTNTGHMKGDDYLNDFVLPNFYFHLTTAYAILRHCGVDIGKRDFLGAIPMKMT